MSLTLNIEGFIGLSSCFHSSTYENHMCKGKYNKFEVEVSFTEYQKDALVTIPDETVMDDFITIFFVVFSCSADVSLKCKLFCNVFLAYRVFSSQSSLG